VAELVGEPVARYIAAHGLYRGSHTVGGGPRGRGGDNGSGDGSGDGSGGGGEIGEAT
jgi:hypothetical protein